MQDNKPKKSEFFLSGSSPVKHKRRGHRIMLIIFLFLLLVAVFVTVMYFFLRIKNVEFIGSEKYTESELMSSSGIIIGDKMYGINKGTIEDDIISCCPYVKSATITRSLPDKLVVTIEEYEAAFYVEIGGEYFVFGDNMRVLERLSSKEEADSMGLVKLIIADVNYAVVGQYLGIGSNSDDSYVRDVMLGVMASNIYDRVTLVNLKDKYNMFVVCDDLYKMLLGDSSDVTLKLNLGGEILKNEMFVGNVNRVQIDLSDTSESSVIIDNQIVFE